MGELINIKFYGVNILVTRLPPPDRRNLWGGRQNCKYVEPNDRLGRTGMIRHQYEDMCCNAPEENPDGSIY